MHELALQRASPFGACFFVSRIAESAGGPLNSKICTFFFGLLDVYKVMINLLEVSIIMKYAIFFDIPLTERSSKEL